MKLRDVIVISVLSAGVSGCLDDQMKLPDSLSDSGQNSADIRKACSSFDDNEYLTVLKSHPCVSEPTTYQLTDELYCCL